MTAPGKHPLLEEASAYQLVEDVLAIRRTIHAHPELGLDLPATQGTVVEELHRLGLKPQLGRATTSVTAVIGAERPGPATLLRADMDALPLTEDTGLPFASQVEGRMHACGHDTHVAMLLGAARLLVTHEAELAGPVLLMFQPGEEGFHGARVMLDEGLLDMAGAQVERAFALHISTRYPSGTLNVRQGPMFAAGNSIHITISGRGGHAAAPHLAADPIPVAAEIVLALQTMVTRTVDVFDPAVLTIARLVAGTTTNIIPETALVEGTVRTVSEASRAHVREAITRVATGIAAAHGLTADVVLVPGYPVTVNDSAAADLLGSLADELGGPGTWQVPPAPVMGAEDFSYVLQRVPGAIAHLGARDPALDPTTAPQNHSNRVVFDESVLPLGVAVYAAAALRSAETGG